MYSQDPPFAVQIELCEGCNLYCDFCGLQGIRAKTDKTYRMMEWGTARALAKQLRDTEWNSRIEFAMHGEPTMHTHYAKMVCLFRQYLPKSQLMMTSNGGGLLPDVNKNLDDLFTHAGLNVFAFDAYEYVKIKDKVDAELEKVSPRRFEIHRYPEESKYSPHNRYGYKAKMFIRVQDISKAETGTHSSLNNHCGAGSEPLKEPMQARCAKPFREMSVRWDGSVAICCNDWRGVYQCGNINSRTIEDIWNGKEMMSARRFLVTGDRAALKPCNVCDAKSYRVGLLPDKFGKKKLRKPDDRDRRIADRATCKPTYTIPNRRPWEIQLVQIKKAV